MSKITTGHVLLHFIISWLAPKSHYRIERSPKLKCWHFHHYVEVLNNRFVYKRACLVTMPFKFPKEPCCCHSLILSNPVVLVHSNKIALSKIHQNNDHIILFYFCGHCVCTNEQTQIWCSRNLLTDSLAFKIAVFCLGRILFRSHQAASGNWKYLSLAVQVALLFWRRLCVNRARWIYWFGGGQEERERKRPARQRARLDITRRHIMEYQ